MKFPSMGKVFKLPPDVEVREKDGTQYFVAPHGYKGFHGTMSENVPSIMEHGLRNRDHDRPDEEWPEHYKNGLICFTEDPEVCEDYGDAVIEADLSGYHVSRFFDEGEEDGVWEVQVEQKIIPPSRLKLWKKS